MIDSNRRRFTIRYWMLAAALFLAWGVASLWLVPALIRQAYEGQSLEVLNAVLAGRDQHPLSDYLQGWAALRLRLTAVFVLGAPALFGGLLHRRSIGERLRGLVAPPEGVPVSSSDLLQLAVWFGLAAGLGEAAITAVRGWQIPDPAWRYSADMVWMSPAVAVAASLVVGVLFRGIVRVFKIEYPLRLYWFVFSTLAAYMLLRTARLGVRVDAAWLLAVGVAVQVARVGSGRWRTSQIMVRRSLLWLAAVVVLLGVGLHGTRYVSERRALALLPAVDGRLPNVLLIILDTVRAQNLSLYGYGRPTTPELRALARDGVVFDRAVATAPWTLPSHASLFTGRFAHELTADWGSPLDDTYPTLAEALGTRGFETVGVVANLLYTTRRSGLQRGFASYHDHPVSPFMMLQNSWVGRLILARLEGFTTSFEALVGKTAETVNQQFLGWLGRRNGDRPFFAFLNYFDAHGPYRPPAPFDTLFTAKLPGGQNQPRGRRGARDFERVTAAYDGGLAYVDAQLGHLLRQMRAMGRLDNTIVIVTSDHGEHLGERANQMVGHGNSLYVQLLHVPLVIVYPPSVPAGLRFARPADIRDIPATVMDLAGLSGGSEFPGPSLSRHWMHPAGTDATRSELILSELSAKVGEPPSRAAQALTAGAFHYIMYGDGSEELYNLENDPAEEFNLAAAPETREDLTRLRASLDSLLSASTGRPGMR